MEPFGVSILLASAADASRLKTFLERGRVQVHMASDAPRVHITPESGADVHVCLAEVAEGLAAFVLRHKEPELVERIARRHFAGFRPHEIAEIVRLGRNLLKDEAADNPARPAIGRRRERLSAALKELLREFPSLHLEGILQFRLHPYVDELKEALDYAVEEFLLEKQYQDFISLLRYFVFMQETRIPAVHLVHCGDVDFKLFDDRLRPMETAKAQGVLVERMDEDLNFEDLIVSTLLTVSPQKVYIHTRDTDSQIIRTIRQIFESRAEICCFCPMCSRMLEESTVQQAPVTPLSPP